MTAKDMPFLMAEDRPFLVTHWHDRDEIPPEFQSRIDEMQKDNPEFRFILLDNQECLGLLNERQKRAFHKVKPMAYKSDICRYAFMKDNKGVYYDSKLQRAQGAPSLFKLYSSGHEEGDLVTEKGKDSILNGLLISKKKNDALFSKALDQSVTNIENNYYGKRPTSVTGPQMLYEVADDNEKKRINFNFVNSKEKISFEDKSGRELIYANKDYKKKSNKGDYWEMWKDKAIYN